MSEPAAEPATEPAAEPAATPVPADIVAGDAVTSSRPLRWLELLLVVGVVFLPSVLYALKVWWTGEALRPETPMVSLQRIVEAGLAISLLAYVLHRQGRSLRSIGLTAKLSDLGWALLILFFARMIEIPIGMALGPGDELPAQVKPALYLLAIVPGAAEEELIVRAFLMTEMAALTGSMSLAVVASVAFQTLYHLYYGVPGALLCAGGFLVYALYYANTRRITPVILAHALQNFWIFAVDATASG